MREKEQETTAKFNLTEKIFVLLHSSIHPSATYFQQIPKVAIMPFLFYYCSADAG